MGARGGAEEEEGDDADICGPGTMYPLPLPPMPLTPTMLLLELAPAKALAAVEGGGLSPAPRVSPPRCADGGDEGDIPARFCCCWYCCWWAAGMDWDTAIGTAAPW